MSVRADVVAQVARYDDDAWAALASRGLLRRARKDLESGTVGDEGVVVLGEDDTTLRMKVGGHEVTFDRGGPARASCSCPSATVCQHTLTAGLWLAAQAAGAEATTTTPESPPAGNAPSPDAASSDALHAALMAFDEATLVKHAGRAGVRWARQLVADLDLDRDVHVQVARHVAVTFVRRQVTVRYLGGSLDALVVDARVPRPERYRVAAVLGYQAANGVVVTAPEAPAPRRADAVLEDLRAGVRERVARLLADTVSLGVAHLSSAVAERYRTAAVSTQGAEYYRLARLLRGLADHVDMMLARAGRADGQRLLDDVALAFALVTALDVAVRAGRTPERLVGAARNRYEPVRSMELIGVGALPWRAPSGYRGLTTVLWWPASERFVSVTDARPTGLASFDPRARYGQPGPWTGLRAPEAATGARVVLGDALASVGGRISAVERTRASVTPLNGAEVAAVLPVQDVWAAVERGGASLLDVPDPLADWAVLRPAVFGTPRFDAAAQALDWSLGDAAGDEIVLHVPYSAENAALVERLDVLGASRGPAAGTLVVCRLRRGAAGITGEPLSLVHPGRSAADGAVEALHFAPSESHGRRRFRVRPQRASGSGRLAPGGARRSGTGTSPDGGQASGNVPPEVTRLRSWLGQQAERGTSGSPATVLEALDVHHTRLREVGLTVFAPPGGDVSPDAAARALLRSCYLVQQLTALLAGDGLQDEQDGGLVDDEVGDQDESGSLPRTARAVPAS